MQKQSLRIIGTITKFSLTPPVSIISGRELYSHHTNIKFNCLPLVRFLSPASDCISVSVTACAHCLIISIYQREKVHMKAAALSKVTSKEIPGRKTARLAQRSDAAVAAERARVFLPKRAAFRASPIAYNCLTWRRNFTTHSTLSRSARTASVSSSGAK